MPGCNSSEDCKICNGKWGDESGFNVHFVFPLSLSSHLLSTLVLLSLMGLNNQHVTTSQSLSLKSIWHFSSWSQSQEIFSLEICLLLVPKFSHPAPNMWLWLLGFSHFNLDARTWQLFSQWLHVTCLFLQSNKPHTIYIETNHLAI
jgi:hypothetical protein